VAVEDFLNRAGFARAEQGPSPAARKMRGGLSRLGEA